MASQPALDIPDPGGGDEPSEALLLRLDDFAPLAILPYSGGHRAFFRTAAERNAACAALATGTPSFGGLTAIDVEDEDWARRSQASLTAIRAGGLIVAPPWDVPARDADVPVIIIEPSMGFGTGHHATTRLCLLALQRLDLRGARVADVGTGSGVLALAAWKLGAADIAAIDHDADAVENARDNIARNGAGGAIDIITDDLASLRLERADVVLANLTGAILMRHADTLRALLAEAGYLVLSGFAPADSFLIRRAMGDLTLIDEAVDGDWAAVTLRR